MFFPSTSSSSTPSTSFASSNDSDHRPHPNHQPRSRAHSTLSLPTTASASVHVRYLYLAGRYRDLSEEHGLGIVGKTGGLLDQVQEESKDRDNSFNTFSGSETDGSIGTSKGNSISQKNNKRRSIRLNDIFLGASSTTNNRSSSSNNNTSFRLHSTPTSSSKIHAPHGARHGSLRGYAQQRLKIQEKIEGRIRRATDTKRLEWEAQAALLASSHPLALLLLTRAGILGSNSASLQLASLYSSGIVRGVSPSVVLVHRDPIRAISWLIRSNEILKLQVETIDQERERLKRDSSLSGGNRRGGVGHRRSLSGQSQRAGLIKSSEATSKLIANCPFSLMTSKSLEDPLTLLNILVRVLRTNQSSSCNGEILNVELINVLEEGSKGIKMTFDEERQNSNNGSSEKANGRKKELWQEVQKLVNWMESRLPNGKQSQNHQESSNDSISSSKRFLTQAQVKMQASQESNQASLDAKGPSSELPLSPINPNTNPNTSYQANTSDPQAPTSSEPVFFPGPDDVDEMIGVASNLREVKAHLSFLNVLMGVRDFSLAFSSNAHESEENPYQILMLKLETLISILEKVSLCSESDQTLPFSSSSFKAHQMEAISRSSSTIVSLSKHTIPMIKDILSLIKALKVSYDEKKDENDLKEKVKNGLKEIGELMEGSLSEIVVPTIPSNGISNGSEIASSLSSAHSNKRLKSSPSTNDLKNRRRKSLEDLVPMDIDSTQQLKESQKPSLLSFPSSQSNLNIAQTRVDNVIAPGEAPIHKRQLGRTLSSVVQLRVAMPSTTNSTGSNRDLLSPVDSLMSSKSGYGFPSSSISGKGGSSKDQGWNALGLGPGSTAKVRRPSSVVSDSPSLLFPNHQDENFNLGDGQDSRANSSSQERGQLQRSDSVNSSASLWTGSIARRRDGNASSSSRRRVTSLYGEPSTAGMGRSVSGTNDLLDSSDFDANSNQITSSSSAQYFNSSGQFDPTKSLRELHSSRRRGSVISNSSTDSNFSNFSSNLPFFGKSDARPPSMRSLSSKASLSSLNVNEHGLAHQMNGSAALGRQAVDSLRKLRGQLPASSSSRNFASDSQNNGEQFDSDFVYQPRRRTGSSASMPAHLINDDQRLTSTNNTGIEPNYGFPTLRRIPSTSSNHSQLGSSSRIPSLRPRPPSMLSPSLSFLQTSISPPEESSSSGSRNLSSGTFSRNGTLSPASPISPTSPNPSNSALGTLRKFGLEAQSRKRAGLPEGMRSPEQANSASSKDEVKDKAGELTSKKSNGNLTNKTTRSFMGIDPTKANSLYGSLSNPSSTNPTPTHPRSPLSPSPSGGTLSGARSPLSDDSDSVQNGSGGGKGKGRAFDSDQLDAVLAQAEERSRLKTDSFCDECGTLVVNAPISKSGLKFCGRDCRMQSKEREKEKRKELERRREVKEKEAKEREELERQREGSVGKEESAATV